MIGNGPSLTPAVLDSLKGQTTIAMNNIALAFPATDWRPTYYLNVTKSFYSDPYWQEQGIKAMEAAEHSFIWAHNLSVPMKYNPDASMSVLSCMTRPIWNNNAAMCVSRWGSSMFAALQIAAYMGFGYIYFIGCDLEYSANIDTDNHVDNAHFHNDYLGDEYPLKPHRIRTDEIRTYVTHEIAKPRLLDLGRYVYICNGGPLRRLYEYIPLKEAIQK